MKSFLNLGQVPSDLPLAADEITELHAGRLLMLLHVCGTAGRIDGLTKLAKLDFFVRYPDAFERVAAHLNAEAHAVTRYVESPMVRYRYGPWDRRYYQVLAFLESRGLVEVRKKNKTFVFSLTDTGKRAAVMLTKADGFADQFKHMKQVKSLLGHKAGSTIKNLIYRLFKTEVAEREYGEVIK